MKKKDLLVLAFLPTVFGVVFFVLLPYLAQTAAWMVLQILLAMGLLVIWWALGRWCGGQDKTPWNSFALLQWWGVVNVAFSLLAQVPVLDSLAQAYSVCTGFFFAPIADLSGGFFYLPGQVLLMLLLASAAFLLGFRMVNSRRNTL